MEIEKWPASRIAAELKAGGEEFSPETKFVRAEDIKRWLAEGHDVDCSTPRFLCMELDK